MGNLFILNRLPLFQEALIMARKPSFKFTKVASGWKVEIPARLSSTGKRQRAFFKTRDEAKSFSAKLRADYDDHGTQASVIRPSLADEAIRAGELLEPFGISLLEAARIVADLKKAEMSSSLVEEALEAFLLSKSDRSDSQIKAYSYMQRDLLKSFAGRSLSSITAGELLQHAEKYATTPSAFNGLARLIGAFWRWSAKHPRGWCDAKIVDVLERKEVKKSEIGVLNASQCEKLLRTAQEYYPECVPGFAIALFTGMRKAELGRLKTKDITAEGINTNQENFLVMFKSYALIRHATN